jgi:toxin YoeB
MKNWEFSFSHLFVKQKAFLKKNDSEKSKKLNEILLSMRNDPRSGSGKPERLKYKDQEMWSRRLGKKNRIIYEIDERNTIITIISCLGHYE